MAEFYAVLDIHKLHSLGNLSNQQAHNNRDYPMNHVDDNLTYLNREIVSTGGLSYRDKWKEILSNKELEIGHSIKVRKNAVIAYDIVTAFSPGAEKELSINLEDWCEANKQWMINTFGEQNIIAMTFHMDETDEMPGGGYRGPHIHTQIIPIDEKNHLCARSFTGTRGMLKHLQTSYGEAMSEFGLSRGERNSKLKHTSRKRWYHTVDTLANMKAPRPKDGETMEQYFGRVDEAFQEVNLRAQKAIEKSELKYQKSMTRQAQIFGEYAYAVNLQHILEESYAGDMKQVNERLRNYQILETSVPRVNLSKMIDAMIEKYPPQNNLAFWRKGKKKKHKKWEDLPDTTTIPTSNTDTSSPIYEYQEEELIKKKENSEVMYQGLGDEKPVFLENENLGISNVFGETLGD